MDVRRGRISISFVVFLWVLASSNSEGNRKFAENGIPWDIQDIDEAKAEELWTHCTRELEESNKAFQDLGFYFSEASSGFDNQNVYRSLLAKRTVQKIITDIPSKEKHLLLECLREKSLSYHESGNESGSSSWFSKCQEMFSSWSTVPRRFLRRRKHRYRAISPAPAPGPVAASPRYALAPSFEVPASSPSPSLQPPSPVLQPPAEAPEPSLPLDTTIIHPPPIPQTVEPNPSGNRQKQDMYITAAIAAGAVAGLAFMSVLLFCCIRSRKNKVGPRDSQNDEKRDDKPLLQLCSSDVSAGSSQKSQSIGHSSDTILNTSSAVSNNVHDSSQVENQSPEAAIVTPGNTHASLPLPPGKAAALPPGPPLPPPKPLAPRAPPPPKVARPPPNPPNLAKPSPLGPHHQARHSAGEGSELSVDPDAPKAKLKPFFWEKVQANPDHSMVWHDIKAGSFQFNEEMMETLFSYAPPADKGKNDQKKDSSSCQSAPQHIQIIDAKKSQNLAILLKALNVTTEEVFDALKEGNELPVELVQTLVKMAPTTDEELKLRLFSGDISLLGPAERFLKVLVDIPFAFKRLEALLFMSSAQEEVSTVTESFATLEVACKELRNSRLFLKLLEAVLKTGNRMNDGTYRGGAQAFKLDTLLKLSDVKGKDGKTTLLHFVVQEIIRSEGLRAARRLSQSQSMSSIRTEDLVEDSSQETEEYHRNLGLQVVSGLSNELENVKKAAIIDGDNVMSTVSKLGHSILKTKDFLNNDMSNVEEVSEFCSTLASFLEQAEADFTKLIEEEKRIMALVKSTGDYFHGNAGKDEGLHLFVVVRDFLIMLDKTCKEVKSLVKGPLKIMTARKEALSPSPSHESHQDSLPDFRQRVFPAIKERQNDYFSSDDESSSP